MDARHTVTTSPSRVRRRLAIVLLSLASAASAQTPMGFGRPPGLGPELDRKVIAQMRALQAFLTGELGVTPSGPPRVKDELLTRNLLAAWRLRSAHREWFRRWYRTFFSTPGAMVLGIDISGIEYSMSHMQADYNQDELGSYHPFQSEKTAHERLARDARNLHAMAQGYIEKLEARLAFEARHSARRPANTPDEFSDLRPNETPTTIRNVYPHGQELVDEVMRTRRKRKGGS